MGQEVESQYSEGLEYTQEEYESLFLRLLMASWGIIFSYIFIFYALGTTFISLTFLSIAMLFLPSIYFLNKRKPKPIYKSLFISICSFLVYLPQVSFSEPGGGDYYYTCVLMLTMILFGRKEKLHLGFCVGSILVGWTLSNVYFVKFFGITVNLTVISYETFQKINFIGSLILGFVFLAILIRSREELDKQRKTFVQSSKLASIGELAAGVGHEINNPLAIANANIEKVARLLKRDDYSNDEVEIALLKYEKAAYRIRNIVDGLRVFARTNKNQFEDFNFVEIVNETILLVSDIFKKDGIDIHWENYRKKVFVHGNPGKIQQVVMNLLSNARDALKENQTSSKKMITLNFQQTKESLIFSVSDNGIGIEKENKTKIFESFFTTKEAGVGSGMGLSISHSIIKACGGELSFESERFVGSQFFIKLPIKNEDVVPPCEVIQLSEKKTKSERADYKVLVVDDEEDIRLFIQEILEDAGYQCEEASNGLEALEKVKVEHFDYILTDVKMPKMNGFEFIKAAQDYTKTSKIVVVTGGVSGQREEQNEVSHLVYKYLYKPFKAHQLFDLFKKVS